MLGGCLCPSITRDLQHGGPDPGASSPRGGPSPHLAPPLPFPSPGGRRDGALEPRGFLKATGAGSSTLHAWGFGRGETEGEPSLLKPPGASGSSRSGG